VTSISSSTPSGGETLERSWRVIKPGGRLVSIVADPGRDPTETPRARGTFFIVQPNGSELMELSRLVDNGQIRPVVQAVYPMPSARAASARGLSGHQEGKIVLRIVA
jgi:NADPH:quinone reductase-like Zn-dependent oxidoreductase